MLLSSLSLSCAQVKIKDQAWWADIGDEGAIELHTLSPEQKDISKSDWDKMRFGMLCTTTDVFSENKKNILKLCEDNPRCTIETKTALKKFLKDVEALEKLMAEYQLEMENQDHE